MGRARLKGERLPNLSVVAEDPSTVWRAITLSNWYGKEKRLVEVVSDTAVWHSTGFPAVPLRWVLIRDPQGEFRTQALLFCTDLRADPERIISWFVMRFSDGGYLSRGTPALGIRDAEALVPKSNPEDRSCVVGLVLYGHAVRSSAHDQERPNSKTNGLVPQELSDLL